MACRGCSSDGCSCSVTGAGNGITVVGSGTPVTDPYVVTLNLANALGALTIDDATDCTILNTPRVPVRLGDGTVVLVPLPCYDALDGPVPGQAFPFTWTSVITATDPGAGRIGFSSLTYTAVTGIHVDLNEVNGTDVSGWLDSLDDLTGSPKGSIRVYSRADPTVWAVFVLTAVDTPAAGMRRLVVSYRAHNGAFSDVIPGDVVLDFAPASEGSVGGFNSVQTIRSVTGADTLVLADAGKYLRCANASAFNLTVPLNATVAFTIGQRIDLIQSGAGQVTVAAAVGVTINAAPGLKLIDQWSSATLVKVGTDEWDLFGRLAA